jgi:effector-binding domain-containing protein
MIAQPKLENRPAQHYAVIHVQEPIPFGKIVQPLHQEVNAWLAAKGLAPSGAPIIRYVTTDMANKLDLEIGWPVAVPVSGDGRVIGITLPAGRYATLMYTGPYAGKGLYDATVALLEWAEKNNIPWRKSVIDNVEHWEARFESYITDPAQEPDPQKWQTELVFLTAES